MKPIPPTSAGSAVRTRAAGTVGARTSSIVLATKDICRAVARKDPMSLIVFKTAVGAPLAILLLSAPDALPHGCIFTIHPAMTAADFATREGQVVFPDRPTEYRCNYASAGEETLIQFENQVGWKFVIRIGANGRGTWSAANHAETISGIALQPSLDDEGCSLD
jgi:hypothetical protein